MGLEMNDERQSRWVKKFATPGFERWEWEGSDGLLWETKYLDADLCNAIRADGESREREQTLALLDALKGCIEAEAGQNVCIGCGALNGQGHYFGCFMKHALATVAAYESAHALEVAP